MIVFVFILLWDCVWFGRRSLHARLICCYETSLIYRFSSLNWLKKKKQNKQIEFNLPRNSFSRATSVRYFFSSSKFGICLLGCFVVQLSISHVFSLFFLSTTFIHRLLSSSIFYSNYRNKHVLFWLAILLCVSFLLLLLSPLRHNKANQNKTQNKTGSINP